MKKYFLMMVIVLSVMLLSDNAHAFIWVEWDHGDAGQLLPTAQTVYGSGSLDKIKGRISNLPGIDMFKIWITGGEMVSVGVGSADFDAQLFVFDSNGYGITGNDDRADNDDRPRLPATFVPAGDAGIYYLAISRSDRDPRNDFGRIFDNSVPRTTVYGGPDGPGASYPIERWTRSDLGGSGHYVINLNGAYGFSAVPEPASVVLLALGLLGLRQMKRRNR